jgi:hypothetical protein
LDVNPYLTCSVTRFWPRHLESTVFRTVRIWVHVWVHH